MTSSNKQPYLTLDQAIYLVSRMGRFSSSIEPSILNTRGLLLLDDNMLRLIINMYRHAVLVDEPEINDIHVVILQFTRLEVEQVIMHAHVKWLGRTIAIISFYENGECFITIDNSTDSEIAIDTVSKVSYGSIFSMLDRVKQRIRAGYYG